MQAISKTGKLEAILEMLEKDIRLPHYAIAEVIRSGQSET